MRGPDSKLRDCYPLVMSFMVDYPEACLICLICMNQACPKCMAPRLQFSCLDKIYPRRTVPEMQRAVANTQIHHSKGKHKMAEKSLQEHGLWGLTVRINLLVRE